MSLVQMHHSLPFKRHWLYLVAQQILSRNRGKRALAQTLPFSQPSIHAASNRMFPLFLSHIHACPTLGQTGHAKTQNQYHECWSKSMVAMCRHWSTIHNGTIGRSIQARSPVTQSIELLLASSPSPTWSVWKTQLVSRRAVWFNRPESLPLTLWSRSRSYGT